LVFGGKAPIFVAQTVSKMFKFTTDSLRWEGHQTMFRLFSADALLVELIYGKAGVTDVKINDRWFCIRRNGFWNPVYTISENEQVYLQMKHQFWGSKAIISGLEENLELSYINNPLLSLLITKGEDKVLRYALSMLPNTPPFKIELGTALLEVDLLLLLITLCFLLTKDIVAEYHGTSNDTLMHMLMHSNA
jgi:hypothetical protein